MSKVLLVLVALIVIGLASAFTLWGSRASRPYSHSITKTSKFSVLPSPNAWKMQSEGTGMSSLIKLNDDEEEEEESESSSTEEAPIIVDDSAPEMSLFKEGIKFPTSLNGTDVRVGIIMARWNADVIQGLYKGVNESLTACGVKPTNIFTTYVPGAYELPITAKFLAASKRVDVIICLGCLIKGDTMHFEYIAQACSQGIMQVSLDSYIPCIFGVLTVLNKEQAVVRSTGTHNEGLSWGRTAVEMGLARMSALGMTKQSTEKDPTVPFVTFNNGTLPGTGGAPKNETKGAKKFGF